MKKIRIAVSGAGNRACSVVHDLHEAAKGGIEIAAVYDPDTETAEKSAATFFRSPDAKICKNWSEALACRVDWALVISPNRFHRRQIEAAFAANCHVFAEKPLATSIADCVAINEAWKKSGRLFATGFVLRYAPIYQKAHEILTSGKIGKLLSVEANENIAPSHGGYILCNWRRHVRKAGPHILEKCCHDLDLIEYFTGDLPEKVAAFHGLDLFLPANKKLEKRYGKKTFCSWPDPHRIDSPFSGDADLTDNLVSIAQFRNGVRVSFNYVMSNAIASRTMRFNGTEGTMTLDLYTAKLVWKNLGDDAETTLHYVDSDLHGGGNARITEELYKSMRHGALPACGGAEGLRSAVYALAIDRAARENKIVDLSSTWKKLGC